MGLAAFVSRVVYVFELLVFQENVKKGKKKSEGAQSKIMFESCEELRIK